MLSAILAYFGIALAILFGLTRMILIISRQMADCPHAIPGLRAAGTTVATGFLTIGLGGVGLASALLPLVFDDAGMAGQIAAVLLASGFVSMVLGLGFTHAMRTLQAMGRPQPVPMEPVLA